MSKVFVYVKQYGRFGDETTKKLSIDQEELVRLLEGMNELDELEFEAFADDLPEMYGWDLSQAILVLFAEESERGERIQMIKDGTAFLIEQEEADYVYASSPEDALLTIVDDTTEEWG